MRECERIQVFHKCINGINWSCNSGNTLIILPLFFEDNIWYMLDKTVRVLYLLFRVCSEFQRGAMYRPSLSTAHRHRPHRGRVRGLHCSRRLVRCKRYTYLPRVAWRDTDKVVVRCVFCLEDGALTPLQSRLSPFCLKIRCEAHAKTRAQRPQSTHGKRARAM